MKFKKRYIIMPLIMGLLLLCSPFIFKVYMASTDPNGNSAEEEPQGNNGERSIGDNYFQYTPGVVNCCFYLVITQELLDYNGSFMHLLRSRSGSNDVYLLAMDSNYFYVRPNYTGSTYSVRISKDSLVFGDYIVYIRDITNNSQEYRLYHYTNSWTYTTLFSSTAGNASWEVYLPMGLYFVFEKTNVFNINNLLVLNFEIPDYRNSNQLLVYPNDYNYYFFKENRSCWSSNNSTISFNLLNFETENYSYDFVLYPNYYEFKSGIVRIYQTELEDPDNSILIDYMDYYETCCLALLYDNTNSVGYLDCAVVQPILTTQSNVIAYQTIDVAEDITDFENNNELLNLVFFENGLGSQFIDTQNILDFASIVSRNLDDFKYMFYYLGYEDGYNGVSAISPFVNLMTNVLHGIDSVLQIEIIPKIKLWYFIAIPLFWIVIWGVLKVWRHN